MKTTLALQTSSLNVEQKDRPLDFLPLSPVALMGLSFGIQREKKRYFQKSLTKTRDIFEPVKSRISLHNAVFEDSVNLSSLIQDSDTPVKSTKPLSKLKIAAKIERVNLEVGLKSFANVQKEMASQENLSFFKNAAVRRISLLDQKIAETKIEMETIAKDVLPKAEITHSIMKKQVIARQSEIAKIFKGMRENIISDIGTINKIKLRNLQSNNETALKLIERNTRLNQIVPYVEKTNDLMRFASEHEILTTVKNNLVQISSRAQKVGKSVRSNYVVGGVAALAAGYYLIQDLDRCLTSDRNNSPTHFPIGRETVRFSGRAIGALGFVYTVMRLGKPSFAKNILGGFIGGAAGGIAGDRLFAYGYDKIIGR